MSLQKIITSLAGIAIVGAGGYYALTSGMLGGSSPADGSTQEILDAAILSQFSIDSVASTGNVQIEIDVPAGTDPFGDTTEPSKVKIVATTTGGGNNLTAALPDLGYNVKLNIAGEDGGEQFAVNTVLDFKLIAKIIYVRLGETDLTLPDIIGDGANFYISMFKDKWFEMPIEELLAFDPTAAAEFEAALEQNSELRAQVIDLLNKHQLFQATEQLGEKNGEIQIAAKLNDQEVLAFVRELVELIAANPQYDTSADELPTEEEWAELEPVLTVVIQEIPQIVFSIGVNDGYIHGTTFEADFDIADLTQKISAAAGEQAPEGAPTGTIAIKFDSRADQIGETYELTPPDDTVNFSELFGSLGLGAPPELEPDFTEDFGADPTDFDFSEFETEFDPANPADASVSRPVPTEFGFGAPAE